MKPILATFRVTLVMGLQLCASIPIITNHSHQNLSSVPRDLPQTVELLDLSCNHIRVLQRGDFQNTPMMRFLNMSWNGLEEIDPETFIDVPLLEDLELSHNRLKNLYDQRYLLHTRNLVVLNLASNKFPVMTLAREFTTLVNLKRLALGAKNISVGDFWNIAKVNLSILTLSIEGELIYEANSMKDVHAERLQIALTSFETIYYHLMDDALSFFDEVELLNLGAGYQDLSEQLGRKAQIRTSGFYLTNISVSWPDFTNFVTVVLGTSITNLSISDVALYKMPTTDTPVVPTSKMQSITVRGAVVNAFFFSQVAVYNFFINLPVKSAALTDTEIIHMTCPKSPSPITQLNFSNCGLSDSIFSSVQGLECLNLNSVRELSLVGNNLKSLKLISKRMQNMTSLQHLDLSLNLLVYDGLGKCAWPQNITNMILTSNGLTDSVFECLPKEIEILDLQNNQVSTASSSLSKLEKLLSLNLNSNRLLDLPICDKFPLLNELLLNSNSISSPSISNLKGCPNLKTLDVSDNPFTCTCALRSFISHGIKSEKNRMGDELVGWPMRYYCVYPEADRGTTLNKISLLEISCNISLQAAVILCPSVVVIIAVLILCQYFDVLWYISMIWQWTRAKHRARMAQVRPEDLVGVEFHAFVSYSQHDAEWVHTRLLPNLEGSSGGLSICHHERNFVPGKTIIDNIITCVQKSRRCVFVLSAHFVKSEWCHYELYFASHERLAQGSDSIVLVLLEPLPQYLIPSKYYQLKSMMGRHTYLEWPQDTAKQRLFWANLRAALQGDLPYAQDTEHEE